MDDSSMVAVTNDCSLNRRRQFYSNQQHGTWQTPLNTLKNKTKFVQIDKSVHESKHQRIFDFITISYRYNHRQYP